MVSFKKRQRWVKLGMRPPLFAVTLFCCDLDMFNVIPPLFAFVLTLECFVVGTYHHFKIRFFLLQNRQGKTRLSKWYIQTSSGATASPEVEKARIEAECHRLVTARDKKYTNFIEYNSYKLIYRRYAGLFFTIAVDVSDNELSYLETIHLFVELLDSYFSNVCELDIVFNFNKVYSILDEFMLAGEMEETSKREILDRVKLLEKME
jgi:AP-2 complex subunit sigma-1